MSKIWYKLVGCDVKFELLDMPNPDRNGLVRIKYRAYKCRKTHRIWIYPQDMIADSEVKVEGGLT